MKDPAFLFYYRDFKSSTENMTNEQRGAYIQLMCIQAENNVVTDQDMLKICSNICFKTMSVKLNEELYSVVKSKFKELPDAPGHFINNRLAEEIEKRIKYSESRRTNRQKNISKSYDKTYVQSYEKHMVNVNENVNRDENIKGGVGEKIEIPQIFTAAELLDTDQMFLEQIAMKQHIDMEKMMHMLTQYDLAKKEQNENFLQDDLPRLRAGFEKWVNSWLYTERRQDKKINGHKPEEIKITREMYHQ
jgi:uncharacterized protein YdaU (DUF1376 family)